MTNKKIKSVYAIIFASILLISLCVGFGAYAVKEQPVIEGGTGVAGIEDNIDDGNNNGGSNDDDENNPGTEEKPSVPLYTNGYKCLKDAFKIIDNGKGVKTTSTTTAVTDFGVGKAVQTVKESTILSGDYYFKENWANCTVSLGQNFYRYFYSTDNGKNVEYRRTSNYSNNVPNWNGAKEKIVDTRENITQNYDLIAYDLFVFRADTTNSRLIKFDRTSDKKYYIISFVYDVNKIPEKYATNIKREGELDSFKYNFLDITYYIEKDTLYLRKIEKNDNYEIKKGITCSIKAFQETYVTSIDKAMYPEKPAYCM